MRAPNAPDGIVCCAGSGAIAVNAGIEAAGKRLGVDLDMVAKQSAHILNWIRPEIMTAYEDVRHAGRELAKSVMARIDGAAPELLQSISQPIWPQDGR
jgi:LacI family transcriptional regulator